MRTESRKRYLPFGYKLMLSYCVLIIIPVLLVGYVANSVFVSSIREQTRTNIQGTLRQMAANIGYKMEDTRRLTDMLYFDSALAGHLRHYEEGWVSYSATTNYLLPKFNSTIEATNRSLWMSVYLHNESLPEIYNTYEGGDPLEEKSRLFDIFHIRRIADRDWYRGFPEEVHGVTMQWRQIEDDETFGRISLLRRIVDVDDAMSMREIGFIRMSVRLSDLFESLDYRKIGEGTAILITEANGRILMSSGTNGAFGGAWERSEAGDQIVIEERLPSENWSLVALVPTNITERDTSKVRWLTLLICFVSFLAFSFLAMFLSRYFAKRVGKIVSVLDSFQEGDFHKRVSFKGNDEFTHISGALNDMGQNIGDLIKEVYLTNIQKKEAELESLQAQINPHFLYNTLSSISRLAKFGETDKLHRMVMDLAKFYRLSLNEGRTVIPILSELDQAKAYVDIQKTKYEDRMDVLWDVDSSVARYKTIKLILQPFIENVLEHAWVGDRVQIRIAGTVEGDRVVFKIIDDGVGMRQERIRQIFDPVEGPNLGYGIRNVDQRIKLHYGGEFGVTMFSRPGIGTTVRITIPVLQS